MMLDFPEPYRSQLYALCAQYLAGCEVLAYGSRMSGNSHAGSDLDIVIKSTDEQSAARIDGFRNALRDSNLPMLIDVLDWQYIPETFQARIMGHAQRFYP